MKIFGFEFKLPETQKGRAKRMLREFGLIKTINPLEEHFNFNWQAKEFLFNLIRGGAVDLDLYKYYKVRGEWCLKTKLVNCYKFGPKQANKYVREIKKFYRNKDKKLC